MLTAVVLAVLVAHNAVHVSTAPAQDRPLHQASTAPDPVKPEPPVKPEQPWPPAGVFRPGGEVTAPQVIKATPANYTGEAMRAKVEGSVFLEAVVLPDGTVGEVHVVRSLDALHGLDDVAVKTVKEWRFTPGKKDGVAVPVVVEVQMSFSLGSRWRQRRALAPKGSTFALGIVACSSYRNECTDSTIRDSTLQG
jgi:TonB family protein